MAKNDPPLGGGNRPLRSQCGLLWRPRLGLRQNCILNEGQVSPRTFHLFNPASGPERRDCCGLSVALSLLSGRGRPIDASHGCLRTGWRVDASPYGHLSRITNSALPIMVSWETDEGTLGIFSVRPSEAPADQRSLRHPLTTSDAESVATLRCTNPFVRLLQAALGRRSSPQQVSNLHALLRPCLEA